jgi:hypothetical protein
VRTTNTVIEVVHYLTFIIPELLSEDLYKGPATKTVAMYESDENDVVENDLDDDDF